MLCRRFKKAYKSPSSSPSDLGEGYQLSRTESPLEDIPEGTFHFSCHPLIRKH